MKHSLLYAMLLSIAFSGAHTHCEQTKTDFYRQIANLTAPLDTTDKSDYKPDNSKQEADVSQVDLTVHAPEFTEQMRLIANLFDAHASTQNKKQLLSLESAKKLHIIRNTNDSSETSLLDILHPSTIPGLLVTTENILNSQNGKENQKIIRYFAENPDELNRAHQALEKINSGLALYCTFYKKMNKAEQEVFDKVFFDPWLGRFNKNKLALATSRILQSGLRLVNVLPFSFFLNYLPREIIKTYKKTQNTNGFFSKAYEWAKAPFNVSYSTVKGEIIGHSFSGYATTLDDRAFSPPLAARSNKSPYKNNQYVNLKPGAEYESLEDKIRTLHTILFPPSTPQYLVPALIYSLNMVGDIYFIWNIYTRAKDLHLDYLTLENMQTKLIGMGKIVRGLQELVDVAKKSDITELNECIQEIALLLENDGASNDLGILLQDLMSSTFDDGDPSWFSSRPTILATYTRMNELKDAFIPALKSIGYLDGLVAAAQLYHNNTTKNCKASYCFVTYLETEQPCIKLSHFWNPLMQPEKAVTNTIHLGHQGDHNILLTGPNGSGKSTNMKGITLAAIMGQTFGIAPATQCEITPLTAINVYLDEQESLDKGLSTFMAEAKKLETLEEAILTIKAPGRSLTIMDETLKGTVEEAGAQRVFEFGQKVAPQEQNICILATHFEKPTLLEQSTDGLFINYHVGLIEDNNKNEFTRTFELIKGANLWWFKDIEKRTRFINWLTQNEIKQVSKQLESN